MFVRASAQIEALQDLIYEVARAGRESWPARAAAPSFCPNIAEPPHMAAIIAATANVGDGEPDVSDGGGVDRRAFMLPAAVIGSVQAGSTHRKADSCAQSKERWPSSRRPC